MSRKQWYEALFEDYAKKCDAEVFTRGTKGECDERYYVPSEITWLLKSLGFGQIEILGANLGALSRNDLFATEDFEMLVIAEKNQ